MVIKFEAFFFFLGAHTIGVGAFFAAEILRKCSSGGNRNAMSPQVAVAIVGKLQKSEIEPEFFVDFRLF